MVNEINEFKLLLSSKYRDKALLVHDNLYINVLYKDNDSYLRETIAFGGYYHEILQYDTSSDVRWSVCLYTIDKCILKNLSNDIDEDVRYKAKQRLKVIRNEKIIYIITNIIKKIFKRKKNDLIYYICLLYLSLIK